jgi:hypothetical protein
MRSGTWVIRGTILVVAAIVSMQFGCGSNKAMKSGYGVPASEGTIKTSEGDNGNTILEIQVKHLAEPSRMASDATVYVVWVQSSDGARQNVGALTLNDNLEGTLKTVTPYRRFSVSVTPEPSGQVSQPTHQPVFTSEVDLSS